MPRDGSRFLEPLSRLYPLQAGLGDGSFVKQSPASTNKVIRRKKVDPTNCDSFIDQPTTCRDTIAVAAVFWRAKQRRQPSWN
jgi:hypothetical protein